MTMLYYKCHYFGMLIPSMDQHLIPPICVNFLSQYEQADSYPWMAALLRDDDVDADYVNSKCGAVLVKIKMVSISKRSHLLSPQIGNRFALTAAHCLYDEDNKEVLILFLFQICLHVLTSCGSPLVFEVNVFLPKVLPASSFSIMLGLHDRRSAKEPNRWQTLRELNISYLFMALGGR